MTQIRGVNNPSNGVHVDENGRIEAHSVSVSEQGEESVNGTAFNLNTDEVTLTNADETPLFYLKNDGSERVIKIPRIFIVALTSTGGSGKLKARISKNPTGGTLLSQPDLDISNFNFGSGRTISAVAKKGGTGLTVTGDISTSLKFLFTSANRRELINFETIVLPRGASMVFYVTPPAGNTSMVVQAGCNLYLEQRTD